MVPRDLHIGNEDFDELDVGDRIRIEIKRSQFRANATHILSIGQYLGRVGTGAVAKEPVVAAPAEVLEEEDEEEEGGATAGSNGPGAEEDGEGDSDEEEEGEE